MNHANLPTVDVIIPSFNPKPDFPDLIEAVLNQDYDGELKVIIVDDCSPEAAKAAYRKLPKQVTLVELPENSGGPATPRNVGLQHSSADFVAFCDNDDKWHSSHLSNALNVLDATKSQFFSASKSRGAGVPDQRSQLLRHLRLSDFKFGNPVVMSGVVMEGRFARQIRFDRAPHLVAVEDFKCWITLATTKGKWVKTNLGTVAYANEPNGLSSNKFKMMVKSVRLISESFGISKVRAGSLFFLGHLLRLVGCPRGAIINTSQDRN